MIDIQLIRDDPERVIAATAAKGYSVDIAALLEHDTRRREIVTEIEQIRAQRNELAAATKGQKPTPEHIEQGKNLKEKVAELEQELAPVEEAFASLLGQVPNLPLEDVPLGKTEDDNVISKTVGTKTVFDFTPKNHWEILEAKDMLDKGRAAKIAGSRFGYLKGDLVRLQLALEQYVMDVLGNEAILQQLIEAHGLSIPAKPFTPVLPPAMLRTEPYVASARLNREETTYKIEQDDLWLNASAEHTLCTMYWNEIIAEAELPIRYIGFLTSFRREAGTYGKDTEGMLRWHQFDKLEMEVFSTPETGLDEHRLLCAIQEYLVSQLAIPYHVLQKCTADIGKPNARGIDLECWFPGQAAYRETHTADYMTDYQTRDLKTRLRRSDGSIVLAHTNDATAFATNRILAAIVENYQTADGTVVIPDVLRPYMAGKTQL